MAVSLRTQIAGELSKRPMSAPAVAAALAASSWEVWTHLADMRRLKQVRADGNPYHRDTIYQMVRQARSVTA